MEGHCAKTLSSHDNAILHEIFNPNLPFDEDDVDASTLAPVEEVEDEATTKVKQLEVEGVEMAEKGDTQGALSLFNTAVEVAPDRASGYNNRAQVLRLLGDVSGALDDLDKAIELSKGKGKVASQAFTQRALIRKLKGEDEDALTDFKSAAALGCEFAKSQVIALNPYAALCNSMMAEMMHKIRTGQEI